MPAPRPAPLTPPGRPLYEEVRAHLTEGIAEGRWKPGEALPPESAIAAQFHVAIGTVRKAVDALVAQGALVRRQGKGTFVTAHDNRRMLFHFFHIVGADGGKAQPTVRTLRFERARADATEAAALAIARDERVIRIRNVLSLADRPVVLDDITIAAALFPGITERIFTGRDNTIYNLYQGRYGINVLRTDEHLRAVLATGDAAHLLQVPAGAPLLEIRRVALTFRDRPVEYRLSRANTAAHAYHNTFGKGEPA
jgi:GntR family transcriptional regulator